jgi:heat-inducible transcriptional repressor
MEHDLLERIENFLNRELRNVRLEEIKAQLVRRLQEERDSSHTIVRTAYEIFRDVLMEGVEELFYFDGASQIVAYPEFREQKKLEAILRVLEGKQALLDILSDDLNEKALKIHIGSENKHYGVNELSVITAGFKLKDESVGRLGVVGPRRIEYDRVVPVVELLSSTVTKMLSYWD